MQQRRIQSSYHKQQWGPQLQREYSGLQGLEKTWSLRNLSVMIVISTKPTNLNK